MYSIGLSVVAETKVSPPLDKTKMIPQGTISIPKTSSHLDLLVSEMVLREMVLMEMILVVMMSYIMDKSVFHAAF